MKKTALFALIILTVFIAAGCEYFVLPGINETICEPPNQLVQDINGNLVCIKIEAEQRAAEEKTTIEEKVEKAIEEEPKIEIEVTEGKAAEEKSAAETKAPESAATVTELPRKVVTEGDLVEFPNLRASDPDGDRLTYTFTEPLDSSGKWKTKEGDAAEYKITITASDGKNAVAQDIIIVVLPKNKPPVIQVQDVITIKEGETLRLSPKVSDPEGDTTSISYSGWSTTPERKTDFNDAGEYKVTVTASDGKRQTSKDVKVVVQNINRPPIMEDLAGAEVVEGETISIAAKASDPDGDALKITYSSPLDSKGKWETKEGDAGSYKVKVVVSDGTEQASKDATLKVRPKNIPPELEVSQEIRVNEGETVKIDASAKDPEGKEVVVTYSGWMRTNTYKTDYDDAGTHKVTVTASDGVSVVTKEVTVIVDDMNRPPSFDPGAFQ